MLNCHISNSPIEEYDGLKVSGENILFQLSKVSMSGNKGKDGKLRGSSPTTKNQVYFSAHGGECND